MQKFWTKLLGGPPARPRPAAPPQPPSEPSPLPPPGATGWKLRFGYMSIVGDFREHNEDNLHIPSPHSFGARVITKGLGGNYDTTLDYEPTLLDAKDRLFIVADGMGGQLAGEQASKMAVEIIPKELESRLPKHGEAQEPAIAEAVRDAMAEANKDILALSHLESEFTNMGTTAVVCLFRRDRAYVAGLGDSRAYRMRNQELQQLTKDHSLADALGDAGTIRPDEVENHRFKHVLYLYLGSKEARSGPEKVEVLDIQLGDRFLLATDGLTGVVRNEELAEILMAHDDPQKTAEELIDRARKNVSKDNITCIVIHFV